MEFLQETREALRRETSRRRDVAERAEFRVGQAALEVVRSSDAAAKLLDGFEELQREVAKRRARALSVL